MDIRGNRRGVAMGLLAIHDPGKVTGTLTRACRARDHGLLPDPACTPGGTWCRSSWGATTTHIISG